MPRTDVRFPSGNDECAAWLYRPDDSAGSSALPIIVMAHGLAGVREMRLDAFAERFVAAGYPCLVFDYRHFGASGGEPRQLLDIKRQLADWRAATDYARSLAGIDPERVIVWGSSFGGGHVIITAARDHRIAAAIAQCPFTDGIASTRAMPMSVSAKLAALGLRDRAGSLLGRDPILVPSYGPPGSTALMTSPDSAPGVRALIPDGLDVPADVAARFALQIAAHFPGKSARKVACPILFSISDADVIAPAERTLKYAATAPRGEIRRQPAGHFDIYVGEHFEHNVADQLEFLTRNVPIAT